MSVYLCLQPLLGEILVFLGIRHRDLKNFLYLYKRNTLHNNLKERTRSLFHLYQTIMAQSLFGEDRILWQRVAIGDNRSKSVQLVRVHP